MRASARVIRTIDFGLFQVGAQDPWRGTHRWQACIHTRSGAILAARQGHAKPVALSRQHLHRAAFMNILLLGSGGREHALAWKIAASPLVTKLWCAPGNAGIAREAECVVLDIADHAAVIDFCKGNKVDLVVVGPETPLAAGIVDDLAGAGIKAFGPSKQAAQLEASKGFTKALCSGFGIPTGAYGRFTNADEALNYARAKGAPIVVKADGLAAGKGVGGAQTIPPAGETHPQKFVRAIPAGGGRTRMQGIYFPPPVTSCCS